MAQVGAFLPTSFVSLGFGRHKKQEGPLLFHRITDAASQHSVSHPLPQRNSANYQPSLWSYDFVQSLNSVYTDGKYMDRAMKLLEEVRRMIKDQTADIWAKLELIDHVQRLGIGYHFDNDIVEVLDSFVSLKTRFDTTQNKSLYEVALSFRLLRGHGYDVSPDIFQKFKNDEGKFKASLCSDVKGMLSLYEATYLGYEGEDILDEAKAFSIMHLQHIKEGVSNDLLEQVAHALDLPVHRRTRMLEARWYIDTYSKMENANKMLLEAAKLDFNIVQSTLQKDLQEVLRWWKGMGLAAKLSFSRDRLVECFFWTVGMVPEPQFSDLRKALTKVGCFITTIDDVYDVYGTLDELELFTAIVERWDINAIHVLPEYMKICFLALYNTINEMAYHALKEHGHNILPYLTKAWTDMLKAFLQEAKWSHDKHLPPFKDYLRNGWVSVSGVLILVHAYFFSNPNISEEALESLDNHHDVLRWPSTIFRLCNDIGTSKAELERGETASSTVCYMHETGVNEERAYDHMESLTDETWKKMNKGAIDSPIFSKNFKETAINLARISHCTYQYGDGHGAPDAISKNRIQSLIIEPIKLHLRKVNPPKYTYNHLKSLGGSLVTRSVNSLANCYRVKSLLHGIPRKKSLPTVAKKKMIAGKENYILTTWLRRRNQSSHTKRHDHHMLELSGNRCSFDSKRA